MPNFRRGGLPKLTDNPTYNMQALRDAFFRLEEQLEYLFNNLDTDNLSEGLSVSINDAVMRLNTDMRLELDTAGIVSTVMDEVDAAKSTFEQTAKEIILRVEEEIMENIGYQVQIVSSHGNIFKNGNIETTLQVVLWLGQDDVTGNYNDACFQWTRTSADAEADKVWNMKNATGKKSIHLTNADVNGRATFFCTFTEPVTGVSLTSH